MIFARACMRESRDMVFDAHEKASVFPKGVSHRSIDDNIKTAMDSVLVSKDRAFNRRFEQRIPRRPPF